MKAFLVFKDFKDFWWRIIIFLQKWLVVLSLAFTRIWWEKLVNSQTSISGKVFICLGGSFYLFLHKTTQFFVPKSRLFFFSRSYTLRRVRDEFKASKSISDPAEISKQLSFARSNLDLIKRQVWLSTFCVCRFKTPFSFIGFQMRLIMISGYDRTSF